MAGVSLSAEAVLEKISQGHLECPICCCRFDKPKILKCLHSFCQKCLEEMVEGRPKQTEITCPVCRQKTITSEAGIAGTLNNFSLMALVDEIAQQEELVKSQRSEIICDVCDEKAEAASRCLECRDYLCDFCLSAHKRTKKTKHHETATISDLRSGKAPFQSRLWNKVPKCQKHSSQEIYFFCERCMMLICAACTAVDHRAPDHKLFNISEAVISCKEKVNEHVATAEKRLKDLEAAKEKVLKSQTDHNIKTVEKHKIVTQKADEQVANIRERERLLKEKVTKICHEKNAVFDKALEQCGQHIEKSEKTLASVKTVMDQANDFDLLKLQQNLLQNLRAAAVLGIPAPVRGLTFKDFQQTENISKDDLGILFDRDRELTGPEIAKMLKVGTRVVRGKDWRWGSQDGYPPGEGVISSLYRFAEGLVNVTWDHGGSDKYRMGSGEQYDLELAN